MGARGSEGEFVQEQQGNSKRRAPKRKGGVVGWWLFVSTERSRRRAKGLTDRSEYSETISRAERRTSERGPTGTSERASDGPTEPWRAREGQRPIKKKRKDVTDGPLCSDSFI